MSSQIPCPDLARLRLFVHEPVSTPGIGAVRRHLAQCEDCRAIIAGFGPGDVSKNTLADSAVDPIRRGMPSMNAVDGMQGLSGDTGILSTDATVCLSAAPSEHDQSFLLADPSGFANGTGPNNSSERDFFLPGVDSSQNGAAGSSFVPTRADAPAGLFPRSGTLEGVTVPGYDFLEELGRDGMGVVYKALHRRLQRLVALKMVLAGAHVGQVGLARFRADAEAVAKLLHPNIVQIFETGEHEGRPFFSLEYVEGGSLDQRIAKSPTTPRGAAHLVETLARTMDVAHQRGIVHRDLKPANILLAKIGSQSSMIRAWDTDSSSLPANHWSKTSVPKIADFGLAKRIDEDSSQMQSGAILGTPSYMAPEQAGGKNREIGPAVDIYALGAILYELLAGRPPFKAGNPLDTVRQVIEQEPVPPRQLEPRVPYDLETICLKCLEKDPARRFATAVELADDLRRFVDGDPILARPTPAWERAWEWGKRRKTPVALLAVIALAIGGRCARPSG